MKKIIAIKKEKKLGKPKKSRFGVPRLKLPETAPPLPPSLREKPRKVLRVPALIPIEPMELPWSFLEVLQDMNEKLRPVTPTEGDDPKLKVWR